MNPLLISITVLALISPVKSETFYNAKGQEVGRASTNSSGTTYYDAKGQQTGRSVTTNTGTTFYNSKGQQTGRSK